MDRLDRLIWRLVDGAILMAVMGSLELMRKRLPDDPRLHTLLENAMQGARRGSTLTQQLAKNLFLKPDRTLERKVQEVLLALWLEHKHSKDQILQMYLNRVYFGAGAYGIEAASQRYFDKQAKNLTVGEAALLAGLLAQGVATLLE